MVSQNIIITGGLGAIGMATARRFASAGSNILLVDRREDDGSAIDQLIALGAGKAVSIAADISDEAAVGKVVDTAVEIFGSLNVIANIAGAMIFKPVAELTAADWREMLDINLVGAALLTGHALRVMETGGSVINVASIHARRTTPLVASYAAAKAGMLSLTRSAAIEGKPIGVRVNAILPGAIDTPMLHDSPAIRSGAEVLDMADVGQPTDIASLIFFLASDEARFITGEDIVADGGRMGRL